MPLAFASCRASKARPAASDALLAGEDRRADPLAPDLQLLDGGGPEGVAGGEHHLQALLPEFLGTACRWWWSCRRRSRRPSGSRRASSSRSTVERLGDGLERLLDLAGQDRLHLLRARSPCRSGPTQIASVIRMAVGTPRSAWTRASSSSSSVASSSLRLVKRPVTLSDRDEEVRRMPSVRRCHQPLRAAAGRRRFGQGTTSAGAGSGAGQSAAAMSGRSSGPASVTMRGSGSCGAGAFRLEALDGLEIGAGELRRGLVLLRRVGGGGGDGRGRGRRDRPRPVGGRRRASPPARHRPAASPATVREPWGRRPCARTGGRGIRACRASFRPWVSRLASWSCCLR